MTDLPEIEKPKIKLEEKVIKRIVNQILIAIGIMIYFLILNLANFHMPKERLTQDIKVFAIIFLMIGIFLIEKAYRKDDGEIAIYGIEMLVLAICSLCIMHFVIKFGIPFQYGAILSAFAFSIYYVMKSIVIYTKAKKEFLASLSDISEIVKKEQPTKKEAVKRSQKSSPEKPKEDTPKGEKKKEPTKKQINHKKSANKDNEIELEKTSKNQNNKKVTVSKEKKETQSTKSKTTQSKTTKKIEKTKKEGK